MFSFPRFQCSSLSFNNEGWFILSKYSVLVLKGTVLINYINNMNSSPLYKNFKTRINLKNTWILSASSFRNCVISEPHLRTNHINHITNL